MSTICSAWRKSFQPAHIEYFQLNFTFLQTSSFKLCTYKFRRETQDNHAPFQSYQKKILYRNISYDNNHTKRPIIAIAQDSIRYSTHFWRNGRIFRHDLGTALIVNARGRHETSRDESLLFRISHNISHPVIIFYGLSKEEGICLRVPRTRLCTS